MKQEIFNQYVDRVCELFSIDKKELFTKNKQRDIVDARHLLYYLCFKRPMRIGYIEKFMRNEGYQINHPSIIHGIKVVEQTAENDADYTSAIKDIERSVF